MSQAHLPSAGTNLKDYEESFHRFSFAISEGRVISLVAKEALRDFPGNLPSSLSETLSDHLELIWETAQKSYAEAVAEGKSEFPLDVFLSMDIPPFGSMERYRELLEASLLMYAEGVTGGGQPFSRGAGR